jgi:outer membrane PBP1 activator LpoA protein
MQFMGLKKLFSFLLIIIALCLISCAKTIPHKQPVPSAPTTYPPDHYLRLAAKQANPTLQGHLQLQAVQAYLRGQSFEQADLLLPTLNLSALSATDQIKYQFALAELALAHNRPVDALEILHNINTTDINAQPLSLQITREKLLATSYATFGQALEAIKIRLDLALLLNNPVDEKNNKRAIWSLSQQLSDETLLQLADNTTQPTLSGWAQLTLIARQDQKDPQKLHASLQAWRAKYPGHPANALLSDLVPASSLQPFNIPKKIAVILPLQGSLSTQANAIWQGILYAYYASPVESRPTLLLYDDSTISIPAIYQQALSQGVDLVLGPLTKDSVMLARKNHSILTLTLNYSGQQPAVNNMYEFGLNLTQDTEQLARRIQEDNRPTVLTITGNDPSSQTALRSFKQQFESVGGKVVADLTLNSSTDLNRALPSLLEFKSDTQTRRQDVDAIFINLSEEQAKTVLPLLAHYGAGDLPVYATSLVDNGKGTQNEALNKVIFVDIPFMINPSEADLKTRQTLSTLFPDQYKNYIKLYAVGIDAYHLVFELSRLRIFPESTYNGATGVLFLDKNQQIYHELSWGQFMNGEVTPLPVRLNKN